MLASGWYGVRSNIAVVLDIYVVVVAEAGVYAAESNNAILGILHAC